MNLRVIAAALAAIVPITPLPAAATCAMYGATNTQELPVSYWERVHRQAIQEDGFSPIIELYYARVLAEAQRCESDQISLDEFKIRLRVCERTSNR